MFSFPESTACLVYIMNAHREVHAAGLSAVKQVATASWRADHVEGIVVIFVGERTEDAGHCSF